MQRKVTEYYCDHCGGKHDSKISAQLVFTIDRKADGAGGMEDVTQAMDLDIGCLRSLCQKIIDTMPHDAQAQLQKAFHKVGHQFEK